MDVGRSEHERNDVVVVVDVSVAVARKKRLVKADDELGENHVAR